MTFEEQAYKEREMFARLNKVRDAQSTNIISQFSKDQSRRDYGQQTKTDELVSFRKSSTISLGSLGKVGGLRQAAKKRGAFKADKSVKSETHTIVKDAGAMETLRPGYNWDSSGYQERAKPTILEQQGLLTDKLPKVPSLIKGNRLNGRHARKF